VIQTQASPDPIAAKTLLYTIIGAVAAVVAAFAGIVSVLYARRGPTREDLKRVESHTEETAMHVDAVRKHISRVDDHFAELTSRGLLEEQASLLFVSVTVTGFVDEPAELRIELQDPSAIPLRIDLTNSEGFVSGGAECKPADPLVFVAIVGPAVAIAWYNRGRKVVESRRVSVRILLRFQGVEDFMERDLYLKQVPATRPGAPANYGLKWAVGE
jgi:hypothetical protein